MKITGYRQVVAVAIVLCALLMNASAPAQAQTVELARPAAELRAEVMARATAPHVDRRMRLVVPFGTALFPPDEDLVDRGDDRWPLGLAQWRALPPSARRLDLLLVPDEDYYWPVDGQPEFRCQFIVHIEDIGMGRSRMTVLQVHAATRHGKRFDPLGRVGPGLYWDIRPSRPLLQASTGLLASLVGGGNPAQ